MNILFTIPATYRTFRIVLFVLFIFTLDTVMAQLSGSVKDKNGAPLPYSNVLLLDIQDSTLVKGTVADQSGVYELQNIDYGKYILKAFSVGYRPTYTQPVIYNPQENTYNLEAIILKEDVRQLKELVVKEEKPLYEQKIDRLVVNVENSITSAGNTVLEILQKSPGVLVDRQNNNITLNGRSGILVMINDKITHLPVDAVVQMLDGMSASNIEKIELITTPPAKYDAEGTAGIIHIVLKENEFYGTNGTFGLNAGYRGEETLGANLNVFHRGNKIGFMFDYTANYINTKHFFRTKRSNSYNGIDKVLETESDRDPRIFVHNLRVGLEYNISPSTSAEILVTGFRRNWNLEAFTESSNTVGIDSVTITEMNINETNLWQGVTTNVGLDHQINKNQSIELDLDYIYYNNNNPSDYRNKNFFPDETLQSYIDVGKKTPISITVGKVDYSNQISDKVTLETGLKASFSDFRNDVFVTNINDDERAEVDSLTNIATLEENIYAAYISTNWNPKDDISIKAGLRYEFTGTNLDTETEKDIVDRHLNNFFPTIYFQKKFSKSNTFQLSYNKRITRPTFNEMAPFVFFWDPHTFSSGNPALRPAIIDTYKANWQWESNLVSLQYSNSKYYIIRFQPETNTNTNVQILASKNLDNLHTWDLTSGIPFSPYDWWDIQSNFSGNYQKLIPSGESNELDIYSYSINLVNTFNLPRNFTLELTGSYQSPSIWGVWKTRAMSAVNLGIQKKFKKGGGVLRLSMNDMFDTSVWHWTLSNQNQSGELLYNFHIQSVNISYTKSFGNNKLKKVNIKSGSHEEQNRLN